MYETGSHSNNGNKMPLLADWHNFFLTDNNQYCD